MRHSFFATNPFGNVRRSFWKDAIMPPVHQNGCKGDNVTDCHNLSKVNELDTLDKAGCVQQIWNSAPHKELNHTEECADPKGMQCQQ